MFVKIKRFFHGNHLQSINILTKISAHISRFQTWLIWNNQSDFELWSIIFGDINILIWDLKTQKQHPILRKYWRMTLFLSIRLKTDGESRRNLHTLNLNLNKCNSNKHWVVSKSFITLLLSNKCHGVYHYRGIDCLFNRSFRLTTKIYWYLCWDNSLVNSPCDGTVTKKVCSYHDIKIYSWICIWYSATM